LWSAQQSNGQNLQQDTGMSGGWLGRTAILLLMALVSVAPANADSPGSELERLPDADHTFTSPDGQVHVEQYSKKKDEYDRVYQFWTFDGKHQNGALLNRDDDTDLAGYPAGFRFSRNSQWLVRMQKLGAGFHTLFLYRRTGDQFSPATPKPLGDMAWDYFFSQPVSGKMHRKSRDRDSLNHLQVHLVQGMDDNYAGMGKHWPDSRYIVLTLSFDSQGEDKPLPWIDGWRCVFDTKTGQFSIPVDFADHNAKAVEFPGRSR
jgi:hypothetical protein